MPLSERDTVYHWQFASQNAHAMLVNVAPPEDNRGQWLNPYLIVGMDPSKGDPEGSTDVRMQYGVTMYVAGTPNQVAERIMQQAARCR